MPRRMRSWSSRSSDVAISEAGAALNRRGELSRSVLVLTCRAVVDLATEVPRNVSAESDVQPAKPEGQPDIAPLWRRQSGGNSSRHETNAHRADHRHAEHPAG